MAQQFLNPQPFLDAWRFFDRIVPDLPYRLTRAGGREYNRNYGNLARSGISTENTYPFAGRNSDAHKLAYLLSGEPGFSDATNARFIAMLKQLGYLQHQAY